MKDRKKFTEEEIQDIAKRLAAAFTKAGSGLELALLLKNEHVNTDLEEIDPGDIEILFDNRDHDRFN